MPLEMNNNDEINQNDCCGNGCANCILNTPRSRSAKNEISKNKNYINALDIYRKYKLIERIELMPQILQLKFKLNNKEIIPEISLILDIPTGHHVMMRAPNPSESDENNLHSKSNTVMKTFTRPYSPFRVDLENLEMEILVNLAPNGKMSHYIQQLKLNDCVEFRGPIGTFFHQPQSYENLLIFTHGVALAPIIRIIEEILNNEDDMTRVSLICCFKNLESILFRDKLSSYNDYWNFNSTIFLSHDVCCNECCNDDAKEKNICLHFKKKLKYRESINPFRLDEKQIIEIVSKLKRNLSIIVICGSKDFVAFITNVLTVVDFPREAIFIL